MQVQHATTDEQILATFAVMSQLRPHLQRDQYVQRIRLQFETADFQLAYLTNDEAAPIAAQQILAAAGYRINVNLAWGKFLYVDDLITDQGLRSQGYGQILLAHLIKIAKQKSCDQFHLDSGVQRYQAHRFYLKQNLDITSHHFALNL